MPVALPPPQGNGSLRAFVRRALSDDPNPTLEACRGDNGLWLTPRNPLSNSVSHAPCIGLFESSRDRISDHPVKPQRASAVSLKRSPSERSEARSRIEFSASSVSSERRFQSLTSLETPRSVALDTQNTCRARPRMASTAVFSGACSAKPREHLRSATTAAPFARIVSRRASIAPASRRPRPPARMPDSTCSADEFATGSAQASTDSQGGLSFRATRSAPRSPEWSTGRPSS